MSLVLSATTLAVGPNAPASFQASGGSPPYTYAVVPGGAGGTISASSGFYTAPNVVDALKLFDTIQATDISSATVSSAILVGTPLHLVCDIIQKEMGLSQGQVYLWDQKINIPIDSNLYVAVGVVSCKPFGNTLTPDPSGPGLEAVQSVNMQALLSIDILSRGPAARDRKEEILLALKSVYAEAQQELNGFNIAVISSGFVNLSQIDGAAIPYRFNISVNMQYTVKKTKEISYFDTFEAVDVQTEP